MAFNTQEQEILKWGVANGKSRQEVEQAISNFRSGIVPQKVQPVEQPSLVSKLGERAKTFGKEAVTLGTLGASTMTPQDFNATGQDRSLAALQGLNRAGQSPIRMAGAVGGAIGDVVGAGLEATGLAEPIGQALAPVVQSDPVQKAMEVFKSLPQDTQEVLGAIVNATNVPIVGAGAKVAGQAIDTSASLVAKGLDVVPNVKLSLSGLDDVAQKSLKNDISSLLASTKGISNKVKLAEQKGVNLNEILSDPQVYRGLKVENAKINPDEAITVVNERIGQLMDAKQKLLPEIDRLVPKQSKEVLRTKAYEDIKGKFTPADEVEIRKAIDTQIDALPDELLPSEIDAFRARARASARDAKGLQKRSSEYSALENASRDTVFEITDNLPVANAQDFKAVNDYVKQMIETQGFLDETLRNQVVKGGRLRNYAMRTVGAIAGTKGGVLGAIAGSEIGGLVADIITNNTLGSSFKMNLIRNITDDPAILKQAEDLLKNVQGLTPNKSLQNTANSTIKTSSIQPNSTTKEGVVNELINNPLRGSVTPSEFLPKSKAVSLEQEAKGKTLDEFISGIKKSGLSEDIKNNISSEVAKKNNIKDFSKYTVEQKAKMFEDYLSFIHKKSNTSINVPEKLVDGKIQYGDFSKKNSIIQDFRDSYRGLNNNFTERTGIDYKLIGSEGAFSNNSLRNEYVLENGKTVEEYLKKYQELLPKKKVGSEIKVEANTTPTPETKKIIDSYKQGKVMYRGEGGDSGIKLTNPETGNALGEGVYYANLSQASRYGKTIKEKTVKLDNPLLIQTDQDLRNITGGLNLNETNPLLKKKQIEEARQRIIDAGYDGVIVKMKNYQDSRYLDKLFGHDQVIDYTRFKTSLSPLEQEAKKYKSAEEFVKSKTQPKDYAYGHRPTEGPRAFNLLEKVDGDEFAPKDMYTEWHGSRGGADDLESIAALKKIKGNPEAEVVIYRASPSETFNYGDWITLSKKYAEGHKASNAPVADDLGFDGGKTLNVYAKKVKAKDIRWAGDDINEFGYYPEDYKSQLTDIWKKANKK